MTNQRFDQFYLTICKQVGGIEQLVSSFFDFLYRKTDFYYESFPGDKMGFPPGYNKQLVFKIIEKYQQEHYKNKAPQRSLEEFNRKVEEVKKVREVKKIEQKQVVIDKQSTNQPKLMSEPQKVQQKVEKLKVEEVQKQSKVDPILNSYNGGTNQKYTWSQQIRQVEVTIQIDPSITAKMLTVQFKPNFISIRRKTGESIVEGELVEKINTSESYWKVEKTGNRVFVNLNIEKAEQKIWGTVFKGDPEIDTTKVNNTKPLNQFDDETQGAIRKIMYEQKRKQMGLPSTEEEQQREALQKAWNAEGSPFKGQPFDPNLINFSGSQFKPDK